MKHLKKILVTITFILYGINVFCQQDGQFSQYMFNPFVINPAYAGSREAFSTMLINRSQWVNIPGAPQTQTLSINSRVKNRVGLGLQIFNDAIGPKNTVGYLGTYSYGFPLFNGKLSFGLRFGAYSYKFNWNKVEYKDPNDIYNLSTVTQKTAINADFGIFYNTKTFYFGLSGNHIANNQQITPFDQEGTEAYLRTHVFATAGNTFEVNENVALQPSLLLRQVENAPLNADINFNMLFYQKVWLGFSYRANNALVLLSQFYITDKLRFGYAFDWGLNQVGKAGGGTHELFIGYDFNVRKTKTINPRYFN